MLSNRPYLLRAFYQWIVDSACTPILVLDATHPRCKVPKDYIEGGEIVFNVSSNAVRDLKLTNDSVEFKASFSGIIHIISAPIKAVLAVYAEENGEGVFFDAEDELEDDSTNDAGEVRNISNPISHLKEVDSISMNTEQFPTDTDGLAEVPVSRGKPFLKLVE